VSFVRSSHLRVRTRMAIASAFLAIMAFGASEGLALAGSDASQAQLQAADHASIAREAQAALACPGAVSARAHHRQFYTLAEAQRCAPTARVSMESRFSLQILADTPLIGYSKTVIVQDGPTSYHIEKLTVTNGSGGSRTVSAAGCPEVSTWNQGRWYATVYINNQTRWWRYWNYCSGGPRAHVVYVQPTCQAIFPYYCVSSAPATFNQDTTDTYTEVQNNYVFCQILCFGSFTANAWQEMMWDSRGWFDYYGWFHT
jgi:hypothetical protein